MDVRRVLAEARGNLGRGFPTALPVIASGWSSDRKSPGRHIEPKVLEVADGPGDPAKKRQRQPVRSADLAVDLPAALLQVERWPQRPFPG